jgi:uncharacterized membrane protein
MQNPPPVQTAKSSTGLDENVAALLSYIFTWVTGLIFYLIEKDSRFVRFHAMQAILLGASTFVFGIVIYIAWAILLIIVVQISDVLAMLINLVLGLVLVVFYLAFLIGWVMCLIKAFQKQYFKLPVLGNFAEKFSTK